MERVGAASDRAICKENGVEPDPLVDPGAEHPLRSERMHHLQPTMNQGMLQDDFLDQNWWPASVAETREEQEGRPKEEAELFCGRNTEHSSGSESPGMESSEAGSRGLESDGSSGRNASMQDKPSGGDRKKTNEQVMRMIQEMRRHLPAQRPEGCDKTSTLCTLRYALKCVRQIQDSRASQAFGAQGVCQADAASYSLEELAALTSEHAPRNTDTFVAVFSLLSGQIIHLSNQAAAILNCKRKILESSCFAELLAPQDLGTFYRHLSQSHLPLWNMEPQTASLFEYAQVRPFFCRLGGAGDRDPGKRYHPFRITLYLVNISASEDTEPEPCCLTLAEKIHSGYEAPRIPLEKRIFTTTHTPGCVFLEVDDRAVPLLGYLPQDLAGTSILTYLHPEDRPLMVAVHRKVLRFAGQPPFEHSPIRFCTQNGDYVILDTSWSSFVNPWSRKVVFVIGRHKVRTSPLDEDIFAARSRETNVDREIWELQGQIHKMLLQVTLQQASMDVNRLKNVGQQLYVESHSRPLDRGHGAPGAKLPRGHQPAASRSARAAPASSYSRGEPPVASGGDGRSARHLLSYQQINCVDSIIRYLEGCSVPALKRKCNSSANASSSSADDDEPAWPNHDEAPVSGDASGLYPTTTTSQPKGEEELWAAPQVTTLGAPMAMATKAPSVGSVTSYSSTLVHFPHPESDFPSKQTSPESWRRTSKQGRFKRQKPQASPESSPCGDPEKSGTAQQASPAPSISAPGFAPLVPSYLPRGPQPPTASAGSMMAVFFHGFPVPLLPPCSLPAPRGKRPVRHPPAPAPLSLPVHHPPRHPCPQIWPPQGTPGRRLSLRGLRKRRLRFWRRRDRIRLPLSRSRSSSPLQLNLLQEELPKLLELPGRVPVWASAEPRPAEEEQGGRADSHSVSSELLDLLLLEDSQSGSGSASLAESLSLVSGCNGTSGCGPGSRNSSNGYLASKDSSEVSKRGRAEEEAGAGRPRPARTQDKVLREDREKLAVLQKRQPRFTEEQKEELAVVHPWIRTQTIPQEINTQGCVTCQGGRAGGLPDAENEDGLLCETLPPPPLPSHWAQT